ncbi:unnamed protein product, partial [Ectocarpus sp. 6 AP-2014]
MSFEAIASLQQLPFRAGGRGIIAVWRSCAGWLFGAGSCVGLLLCQNSSLPVADRVFIGILEDHGGFVFVSGATAVHVRHETSCWSHVVLQSGPRTTYDSVPWDVAPTRERFAMLS